MTWRRSFATLFCLAATMSCGEASVDGRDEAAASGDPSAARPGAERRLPGDTTTRAGPMIHPRRDPTTAGAADTTPTRADTERTAGPDAPAATPVDTATWSIGTVSAPPTVSYAPLPVLTALRTGTHAGYERLTLELGEASGLPSYHVQYVDRPLIECGSGNQLVPVGDAWLELRLEPAAAHTEAGQPTIGAREIVVGGPLLLRVHRTCDFEGVVSLVMALAAPNPYRVLTLSDPWRIVVDVRR